MRKTLCKAFAACLIAAVPLTQVGAQVTPLIDPDATGTTQPNAISGDNIVGFFKDAKGSHGFLYDGKTFTTLDYPGTKAGTEASGVDGSNVVGCYPLNKVFHGFLFDGKKYTTFDHPQATGTELVGISGNLMAGNFQDAKGSHGFLYDGSKFTPIDDPMLDGGLTVNALCGNRVVGLVFTKHGPRGFLDDGGKFTTLLDPQARDNAIIASMAPMKMTMAFGVSEKYVVGSFDGFGCHGFIYDGHAYVSVDLPGQPLMVTATGVSGNKIVGYCFVQGHFVGFVANLAPSAGN